MLITANTIEAITKIFLIVILSALIGFEREARHKGAGLRTHILVGVGSTLIVLTSFHIVRTYTNVYSVDPTRMLTGIITGIGFLCAGTIIRGGTQITGLTTAATVWIVACLGMAVGAGLYIPSIFVSLLVFIILITMRSFETKIRKISK